MLVNFCDTCLRTDVTCSTVSTEGYEVSNLVNNSDKGFLAYSCIKPPVSVDFVFICNIQISHIIIWPQIGAQKSTGFQLSVKQSDNQPLTNVSTAFLQKEEGGVLFYRRDISHNSEIRVPPNFLRRDMKPLSVSNYASTLRLSILKTDNSVPALGKVEIWGRVAFKCGKDVAMNVMALWTNRFNNLPSPAVVAVENENKQQDTEKREQMHIDLLNVPEDFLDPITFEIMTQPIILPSGKIIDQKTLEKHGQSEALWGRPVSDPFTGIRFNDIHRPIPALPLKARIDKFLLENSNEEEIKKLPRVLGSKLLSQTKNLEVINCIPSSSVNSANTSKTNVNNLKRVLPIEENKSSGAKKSFYGHALPVAPLRNSSSTNRASRNSAISIREPVSKEEILKRNAAVEERLNEKIHVSSMTSCKCCTDKIFYKLPCEHVICRKALLLLEKNECTICKLEFQTSDPKRFHLSN